ncbi:MAG: hypothetical protein QOI96_681 [Verrucomicrobiota bacterium]
MAKADRVLSTPPTNNARRYDAAKISHRGRGRERRRCWHPCRCCCDGPERTCGRHHTQTQQAGSGVWSDRSPQKS